MNSVIEKQTVLSTTNTEVTTGTTLFYNQFYIGDITVNNVGKIQSVFVTGTSHNDPAWAAVITGSNLVRVYSWVPSVTAGVRIVWAS